MASYLPPHILQYFTSNEIPYAPPMGKLPHEKPFKKGYSGVGDYMKEFKTTIPLPVSEPVEEIKKRLQKERAEQEAYITEQKIAEWDPKSRKNITKDPFTTLFVGRLNYDTKESKLKREFEIYGPIKKIYLVQNSLTRKPRGYAFIEYEQEKDMIRAFKRGGGTKIDGHRVVVDVERGRTVNDWLPRKFGGGLGGRIDEPDNNEERRIRHRERDRSGNRRCSRSRSRRRSRSRSRDKRRRRISRDHQVDEDCETNQKLDEERHERNRRRRRRCSRSSDDNH